MIGEDLRHLGEPAGTALFDLLCHFQVQLAARRAQEAAIKRFTDQRVLKYVITAALVVTDKIGILHCGKAVRGALPGQIHDRG